MSELSLVPPDDPGFDQEEVKRLLMENGGDVTEAAKIMDADPERLRRYVYAMPRLKSALEETMAQAVDQAVGVLFEGLRDQGSFQNRYYAAKEILRSQAGARRGFGPRQVAALEIKPVDNRPHTVSLKWLEPPAEVEK
jgi:hypothetical protein